MSRNFTSFLSLVLGGACLFANISGCMLEQPANKRRNATVGKSLNNIRFLFRIIFTGTKAPQYANLQMYNVFPNPSVQNEDPPGKLP